MINADHDIKINYTWGKYVTESRGCYTDVEYTATLDDGRIVMAERIILAHSATEEDIRHATQTAFKVSLDAAVIKWSRQGEDG